MQRIFYRSAFVVVFLAMTFPSVAHASPPMTSAPVANRSPSTPADAGSAGEGSAVDGFEKDRQSANDQTSVRPAVVPSDEESTGDNDFWEWRGDLVKTAIYFGALGAIGLGAGTASAGFAVFTPISTFLIRQTGQGSRTLEGLFTIAILGFSAVLAPAATSLFVGIFGGPNAWLQAFGIVVSYATTIILGILTSLFLIFSVGCLGGGLAMCLPAGLAGVFVAYGSGACLFATATVLTPVLGAVAGEGLGAIVREGISAVFDGVFVKAGTRRESPPAVSASPFPLSASVSPRLHRPVPMAF